MVLYPTYFVSYETIKPPQILAFKIYKSAPDTLVKWVTNLVIGFAVVVFGLNVFFPNGNMGQSPNLLILFFPLIFLTWAIHPTYYSITDSSIKLKRPFSSLEFSFDSIREVRRIMPADLGMSFRLFASGGLFGYLGLYNSNKIGKYTMWCTNQDEMVLIVYNDRKVVISPTDAGSFTNDFFFKSKEYYSLPRASGRTDG